MCNLELLFHLASAVFLGSESRGPHYHISTVTFETSPTRMARFLHLFPQEQRGPVISPDIGLTAEIRNGHYTGILSVPHRKQTPFPQEEPTGRRGDVYCDNHMKHISTLWVK
jgi:hypothetical protein